MTVFISSDDFHAEIRGLCCIGLREDIMSILRANIAMITTADKVEKRSILHYFSIHRLLDLIVPAVQLVRDNYSSDKVIEFVDLLDVSRLPVLNYLCEDDDNVDMVDCLLSAGASSLQTDPRDGCLPLHEAAKSGCLLICKRLASSAVMTIKSRDHYCTTPLDYAGMNGHLAVVNHFLHIMTPILDIEFSETINDSCIIATSYGQTEIVRLFLSKGVAPELLLFPATKHNFGDILKILVDELNVDIHVKDVASLRRPYELGAVSFFQERGYYTDRSHGCAIHEAQACFELDVLCTLIYDSSVPSATSLHWMLECGVFDLHSERDQKEYLKQICTVGEEDILAAIIERGSSTIWQDKSVFWPQSSTTNEFMIIALQERHASLLKIFLQNGCSPNNVDFMGSNYLYLAIENHAEDIAMLLLEYGANVNSSMHKMSALIAAVKGGHLTIVETLLQRGADVNLQGMSGTTALHEVSLLPCSNYGQRFTLVKALLLAGADPDLKDDNNLTASDLAVNKGVMDVWEAIIQMRQGKLESFEFDV